MVYDAGSIPASLRMATNSAFIWVFPVSTRYFCAQNLDERLHVWTLVQNPRRKVNTKVITT